MQFVVIKIKAYESKACVQDYKLIIIVSVHKNILLKIPSSYFVLHDISYLHVDVDNVWGTGFINFGHFPYDFIRLFISVLHIQPSW